MIFPDFFFKPQKSTKESKMLEMPVFFVYPIISKGRNFRAKGVEKQLKCIRRKNAI